MNIKEIKEIIELMKENNINEFEMERDGLKISLKRGMEMISVSAPSGAEAVPLPASAPAEAPPQGEDNTFVIKSPMVGTFYSAPSPDSPPYVVKGTGISENDVVCILEAMKVMNEIRSEHPGVIKEILVKNGEPVEFNQPLFVVEKV